MRASFEKRAGDNFDSWEHRIDHQLAFAHDRIDIVKYTGMRLQIESIGQLQGRADRLERRVGQLEDAAARQLRLVYVGLLVIVLTLTLALVAVLV